MAATNSQIFSLQPYGRSSPIQCTLITPQPMPAEVVTAAWSYAVRYTAKGLDLPDHEAAIELMKSRHPSWTIIRSNVQNIGVNLTVADQDNPETKP